MSDFIFNTPAGSFTVPAPAPDSDNWFVTSSESVSVSKEVYMMDAYRRDFPNGPIKDFQTLSRIVSRSAALQDWYARNSASYIDYVAVPTYASDVLSPSRFKGVCDSLKEFNKALSIEGKEVLEASRIFNAAVEAARNKRKRATDKLTADKVVRVLTMNSSELPITMQLAIEGFTPKTDDQEQSKDKYARELLYIFKRSLLAKIQDDPSVDIDSFIKSLAPF